jgi:hypothetical protein
MTELKEYDADDESENEEYGADDEVEQLKQRYGSHLPRIYGVMSVTFFYDDLTCERLLEPKVSVDMSSRGGGSMWVIRPTENVQRTPVSDWYPEIVGEMASANAGSASANAGSASTKDSPEGCNIL